MTFLKMLTAFALLQISAIPISHTAYAAESEIDRSNTRAAQQKAKRDHERRQQQNRRRSQAERRIDKIPSSTIVRPIYKDGGVGVKVIIPIN